MKPVIKWTGSKRSQAKKIISFIPDFSGNYIEPFVGGGSVLYEICPKQSIASDVCEPLINLWNFIKCNPIMIYESYKYHWEQFCKDENYYYQIREKFNSTNDSLYFFS